MAETRSLWKRRLRLVALAYLALFGAAFLAFLDYYLPDGAVVHITGTEIKRMDARPATAEQVPDAPGVSRDVRFIITQEIETGRTRVFRNEDTRGFWPPYLKYNSADLAGDAINIAQSDEKPPVLIRYYGWRIALFDMFPNALSLRVVEPSYTYTPWTRIVVFVLLVGGSGWAGWRIVRWMRRRHRAATA